MKACFSFPVPARSADSSQGSFTLEPVVLEDSKLIARERDLHKLVAQEEKPTLAGRDVLTINLACIDQQLTSEQPLADRPTSPGQAPSNAAAAGPTGMSQLHAGLAGDVSTQPSARPSPAPVFRPSISGSSRGFVRVASARSGNVEVCVEGARPSWSPSLLAPDEGPVPSGLAGLTWTPSRRILESLILRETSAVTPAGAGQCGPAAAEERRLLERLERLSLDVIIMAGDGNCQFRALANELFGNQEHHAAVRRQVIQHIRGRRDEYEPFLAGSFEAYVKAMSCDGTWGDELTLRAACDSYGATVRCITSQEANWYITYQPECQQTNRELFLMYHSPIHYNALKRRGSLRRLTSSMSSKLTRMGSKSRNSSQLSLNGSQDLGPARAPGAASGGIHAAHCSSTQDCTELGPGRMEETSEPPAIQVVAAGKQKESRQACEAQAPGTGPESGSRKRQGPVCEPRKAPHEQSAASRTELVGGSLSAAAQPTQGAGGSSAFVRCSSPIPVPPRDPLSSPRYNSLGSGSGIRNVSPHARASHRAVGTKSQAASDAPNESTTELLHLPGSPGSTACTIPGSPRLKALNLTARATPKAQQAIDTAGQGRDAGMAVGSSAALPSREHSSSMVGVSSACEWPDLDGEVPLPGSPRRMDSEANCIRPSQSLGVRRQPEHAPSRIQQQLYPGSGPLHKLGK